MTKYFDSTFNLLHTYLGHSGLITVNVLKFQTPSSVSCSQIKCCFFRAIIHKNAVRIANREVPDQIDSSEAV